MTSARIARTRHLVVHRWPHVIQPAAPSRERDLWSVVGGRGLSPAAAQFRRYGVCLPRSELPTGSLALPRAIRDDRARVSASELSMRDQ
jgi:hypothetical protein